MYGREAQGQQGRRTAYRLAMTSDPTSLILKDRTTGAEDEKQTRQQLVLGYEKEVR